MKNRIIPVTQQPIAQWIWHFGVPHGTAWFRSIVLVVVGLPLIRTLVSGFLWFNADQLERNPLLWLLAIPAFGLLHIVMPIVILAGLYHICWFKWRGYPQNVMSIRGWQIGQNYIEAIVALLISCLSFFGLILIINAVGGWNCTDKLSCVPSFNLADTIDVVNQLEYKYYRQPNWFLIWLIMVGYCYQWRVAIADYLINKNSSIKTNSSTITEQPDPVNTINDQVSPEEINHPHEELPDIITWNGQG